MDDKVAMLYHFSVSLDDNVDENIDTGKIGGPEGERVIIVLHLNL